MGDSYFLKKKEKKQQPPQPIKFSVLLLSSTSSSSLLSCRPEAGIRAGQGSLSRDLEGFPDIHTEKYKAGEFNREDRIHEKEVK